MKIKRSKFQFVEDVKKMTLPEILVLLWIVIVMIVVVSLTVICAFHSF
jgi:hypothetical protein